jgi:pimeloyl-ACP methyl ester carboxylesterase
MPTIRVVEPEISRVTLGTGITLSYAAAGDAAGPCVVFLPGPTDSWRSYEPVLQQLPRSIRALAVSQRGHGDSDTPPNGYRVEDFAGDVPALLDALGVERAVLAGHSGSCRRFAGSPRTIPNASPGWSSKHRRRRFAATLA